MARRYTAHQLYTDCVITDHGVRGKGGSAAIMAATYGSGKTTLMAQSVEMARWVDPRFTKRDYYAEPDAVPLYHTTCLWFPSRSDHWSVFIPEYARRCFPHEPEPKPFLLHHFEGDSLAFYHVEGDSQEKVAALTDDLIRPYHDERDLLVTVQNEGDGGINVVFPPQKYTLPDRYMNKLEQILKFKLILSRRRRARRLGELPEEIQITVEPHVFYHQLIDYFLENKNDRHMAIFYDDIGRFAQAYQTDLNFHLISIFAGQLFPEMRKRNMSFYTAAHDLSLMDWKVLDRFRTYFWLPSSLVVRRLSMVWPSAVRNLSIGQAIIEDREKGFAWPPLPFRRIPHQPPVVVTKGLT